MQYEHNSKYVISVFSLILKLQFDTMYKLR